MSALLTTSTPPFPKPKSLSAAFLPQLNMLLPKALGLRDGEAYVIKNAG
jgi:hypothetical protein